MAQIKFTQPKIGTWKEILRYEDETMIDDPNAPAPNVIDDPNAPAPQIPQILKYPNGIRTEEDPRTEVIVSAQILSVTPVIDKGSIAQDVFIEMSYADGQTTYGRHCIISQDEFHSYDNDVDLLRKLLKENFNIS